MIQRKKESKKILVPVIIVFFLLFLGTCTSKKLPVKSELDRATEEEELSSPIHSQEVMAEHDVAMTGVIQEDKKDLHEESYTPLVFREIWAYLIDYDEASLKTTYPITDIGYFGAGLSTFGKLTGVPSLKRLSQYKGRVHVVIADNSKALTHFCLDPSFSVRNELLTSIIKAAEPFDGVQIDFELVSAADKEYFWSFLRELKEGIGTKILSVAIPARTKTLSNDAYDYASIANIVDRIIVMAYDEHWSGSKPGSIASLAWCKNVSIYAQSVIPSQKLVMGLPFYGRAWSNDDTTGAYRNSSVQRVMKEQDISTPEREQGIPTFSFSKTVTFTFFFEDIHSLHTRLSMYKEQGIASVAFWRLGQEDTDIWSYVKTE